MYPLQEDNSYGNVAFCNPLLSKNNFRYHVHHCTNRYLSIFKLHSYKNGPCNLLKISKRPFLKPISDIKKGLQDVFVLANPFFIRCLVFFFTLGVLNAQNGCPDCQVQIPDSLQIDTFFLEDLPTGIFQTPYTANVSFRLPVNTNEVLFLDPSLPANVGLNSINIKSITNLPAGLIWTPSQDSYDLPDERNGCVTICGLPLQFGTFEVAITVTANIAGILNRDATFSQPLIIAPPSSDNVGFTLTNNVGCGSTTVAFNNNNPSNGRAGFQYFWDFGNGNTSNEEQPEVQVYTEADTYRVNYQAIIDTIGPVLTQVTIQEADCNDFLNAPDYYFRLFDALDTLIFTSNTIDNTNAPVDFFVNIPLANTPYRLEVWEGDSGLNFEDDFCGALTIRTTLEDTLQTDGLSVLLNIIQTADTVRATDSIIVHPLPDLPEITVSNFTFCEGDSALLTSSYPTNNLWSFNGVSIDGATNTTFIATAAGEYSLRYTSEEGCIVFSDSIIITTNELPEAPVFINEDNVLSIFNPDILPDDFVLQWFQEGNLLDQTGTELCITETGQYRLQLTNVTTGCSNVFETVVVADDAIDCISSAPELADYLTGVRLYPNPTTDFSQFEFLIADLHSEMRLSVINVLGQSIFEQQLPSINGLQTVVIDLSNEVRGVYWLLLENELGVSSWKLVKQ